MTLLSATMMVIVLSHSCRTCNMVITLSFCQWKESIQGEQSTNYARCVGLRVEVWTGGWKIGSNQAKSDESTNGWNLQSSGFSTFWLEKFDDPESHMQGKCMMNWLILLIENENMRETVEDEANTLQIRVDLDYWVQENSFISSGSTIVCSRPTVICMTFFPSNTPFMQTGTGE